MISSGMTGLQPVIEPASSYGHPPVQCHGTAIIVETATVFNHPVDLFSDDCAGLILTHREARRPTIHYDFPDMLNRTEVQYILSGQRRPLTVRNGHQDVDFVQPSLFREAKQ